MNNIPLQINLSNRLFDLSTPVVMGIMNVTPDSFYKGNRFTSDKGILNCTEKILAEGGSIVDIGGDSTRPSASLIGQDEEIRRVSIACEIILKKFPDVLISIDTFRSSVVREIVKNYRIALVNDIGGGTLDPLMFETIADLKLAYILMHTRGNPKTMQSLTQYTDITSQVILFLEKRLAQLRLLGVTNLMIDPGFGFAKTLDQNYTLLHKLHHFADLNVPIIAGISRKSMIYSLLETKAEEALNGTTAANVLALCGGASILRVHDVKEAMQAIRIFTKYRDA